VFEGDGTLATFNVKSVTIDAANASITHDKIRDEILSRINSGLNETLKKTPREKSLDTAIAAAMQRLVFFTAEQRYISSWETKPDRLTTWFRW
jgi:hypothetical protein